MTGTAQLDWSALEKLIPLCWDFYNQHKAGETINVHDAAHKVGQAFGIENIDEFVKSKARQCLTDGLDYAFDADEAQFLKDVFSGASKPVMDLVADYAHGGKNAQQLMNDLNGFCLGNVASFNEALQAKYGIPADLANPIAEKLGPGVISIHCFTAAFEIYQKAAQDAALAKERRIEAERLAEEAIASLKTQREQMDALVNGYLLDRLAPFGEGIRSMDRAVLDSDDNGFIEANAQLWELFGRQSQYSNESEFEDLMLSDETFKL